MAAVAQRLNLKTRHGREIARAAIRNPNYVIPPEPPEEKSKTMTLYQQAVINYRNQVHELRVGYQKQYQLWKQSDDLAQAKRVEKIMETKAKRKELVNYEKSILKAKRQEADIQLAAVKADERAQHAQNRIKYEEILKARKLHQLKYLLKEREAHWVENHALTPFMFESRYDGITGFWVKVPKKVDNRSFLGVHSLFMSSVSGRELSPDEEDELKLIDYRTLNNQKTSYHPADIVAPQFRRPSAERLVLKRAKAFAKQEKLKAKEHGG